MDKNILQKLKDWRAKTARRAQVDLFRVISNQAVEEIARVRPQNKEDLLEIKGIKEKKYAKYGEEILAIVRGEGGDFAPALPLLEREKEEENRVFDVGEYLDILNEKLLENEARVKGEVSSVDVRGNYIFFSIKDKEGESMISCFAWRNDYQMSGVELEEGMEVLIWGYPNIYKPSGRLSFQTKLIELVGEGLLKKAYDELRRKLEKEGLFAPERKKRLPRYIHKIGLVTSQQGAAIGDFISNVGNYGYKIRLYNSRVEGKQAIFDLIRGLKWFNENISNLDVIVLVRGGGSLESLQAFNSEVLAREVVASKIPVLAGIGHEQDVTLAAMAADLAVSTPTAAALEIRKDWDEAVYAIDRDEKNILNIFEGQLADANREIREAEYLLSRKLNDIFERFRKAREGLKNNMAKIGVMMEYEKKYLENIGKRMTLGCSRHFSEFVGKFKIMAEKIALHSPERQLRLGYSLVSFGGKIIRSVKDVKVGEEVDVKLSDGEMKTEIKKIL